MDEKKKFVLQKQIQPLREVCTKVPPIVSQVTRNKDLFPSKTQETSRPAETGAKLRTNSSQVTTTTTAPVRTQVANLSKRTQDRVNHSKHTKAQAWRTIIDTKGIRNLTNSDLLLNQHKISNIVHAISDSGATAHFIVDGAPVTNVKKAEFPLRITCPNGQHIFQVTRAIWISPGSQKK